MRKVLEMLQYKYVDSVLNETNSYICRKQATVKHILLIICIFLSAFLSAEAQDYHETIRNNPAWAASNLYQYVYSETVDTPAPKGYKPFYINHYGRHGSRYMSSSVESDAVREVFAYAEAEGLLTEAGKMFWRDAEIVLEEQSGAVGMLTSKGAEELYGIGERMGRRFSQIFKGDRFRKTVKCVSSTSPRCLISMTKFTDGLKDQIKGLEYCYITGADHYAYLAYHPEPEEGLIVSGDKEMAFRRTESLPELLFAHFFTETDWIKDFVGGDIYWFERRLYQFACVGQLTDYGKCLLEYFPEEPLVKNWEARNARFYVAYANSKELPHYATQVATPLLKKIIGRIDLALQDDSDVAADLCFGHDVTLMPLISHIGIRGMHERLSFEEVNGRWDSAEFIGMGSNIQFVFYRNNKGDILVKILYNEKETDIPALKTFQGPYYRWEDLRNYLVQSIS